MTACVTALGWLLLVVLMAGSIIGGIVSIGVAYFVAEVPLQGRVDEWEANEPRERAV